MVSRWSTISATRKLPTTVTRGRDHLVVDVLFREILVVEIHVRGDGGRAGPGREGQDFAGEAAGRRQHGRDEHQDGDADVDTSENHARSDP